MSLRINSKQIITFVLIVTVSLGVAAHFVNDANAETDEEMLIRTCLDSGESGDYCFDACKALYSGFGCLDAIENIQDSDGTQPGGTTGITNPLGGSGSIAGVLDAVANFLFGLVVPLFIIMAIWGGFQLLTARGNPESISKGKKTLTWAVIGLLVVLLAASIAAIIQSFLSGGGGGTTGSQSFGGDSGQFVD